MVHRPKYGDWAWSKGKLDPGEDWPAAAVREVFEETGFHVRLGRTLPTSEYTVPDQTGQPTTKECRYWAAEVMGGDGTLVNEIDEVARLDVPVRALPRHRPAVCRRGSGTGPAQGGAVRRGFRRAA